MDRKTAIFLNGGAGRMVSSIPAVEKSLEEKTGLSVQIKNKKNNVGTISFEYKNLEQLDHLINLVKKNY